MLRSLGPPIAPELLMKPRVLCLTSNFPRWSGDSTTPFVLQLCQDLQEQGWEVDVLAPHAEGAQKQEELGGVSVTRFQYAWPASRQTVCYQGGALVNLQKRPGEKLKLPVLVAAEWWAARRMLARKRYDIVHSHWILPQGFVGMQLARSWGIPHVVTVHGGDVFALRGRVLAAFKKKVLQRADWVTVNSSVTEAAVLELCPKLTHRERRPMGVGAAQLNEEERAAAAALRAQYGAPGQPLLLFVGRLVEEKGIFDLLRAQELLVQRYPGAHLLIAGEGQERDRLSQEILERGLGERVTLTGWVQPEQVRHYLGAADVFVGPSKQSATGWKEAQGLTFLEAMSVGTPVVATRSGGIVDSITHEETGLLVAENAPEEICSAVVRLLEEPDWSQALALRAQARVQEEFSREAAARSFDQRFRTLMASR